MSLDKNTGAKRAREARADLGYTRDGPLPDLVEAIEEKGGAHVVVLELPVGVAGAYVARADCPLLFVNGHQALARQRFTVAHEFGHHRMGHASVVDEQQAISGTLHDPQEVRANAFAAEFLMPREAITAWGSEYVAGAVTLEQVLLLACEYAVSAQAARYALQNAGVLSDARRLQATRRRDRRGTARRARATPRAGVPARRARGCGRPAAADPERAAQQRTRRPARRGNRRRAARAAIGSRARRDRGHARRAGDRPAAAGGALNGRRVSARRGTGRRPRRVPRRRVPAARRRARRDGRRPPARRPCRHGTQGLRREPGWEASG